MQLKAVKLRDFRAYKGEVVVPISTLTALIGKNDIGKSSILEAIGIFLGGEGLKPEASDLCVHAESAQFRIGCVFTDLPPDIVIDATSRTTLGAEHLLNEDGDLEIHHVYERQGDKLKDLGVIGIAQYPSAAGVDDLLLLKNADLKKRATEREVDTADVDLRSNVQLRQAIWGSAGDLQVARTELPLNKEDAKTIWDQLSEELPVFALFKADRPSTDNDAEVQDPMGLAVRQALAEVQAQLEAVKRVIEQKAIDVANRTLDKLREMDPALANTLAPQFRTEPKWDSIFKLSLAGDDAIPLNKRGSGFRRLVLLSFFQAEAERQRNIGGSKNIVYAIEEPEASQHPDNQRMLIDALKELATAQGCQVILTTHVPALAGLLPTASVRHITRGADRSTTVEHGGNIMLQHVADDLGVLPDARVSVFVCVEGPHDVKCLKHLVRAMRTDDAVLPDIASDRRIAPIPLGGDTLRDWVDERYLRHTGIPEVHIYDKGSGVPPKYQGVCDQVNSRGDGSQAFLTQRPEMENYLHPEAIQAALNIAVTLPPDCDVPDIVAQAVHQAAPDGAPWDSLDEATIKRKHRNAKRRLNNDAAEHMTSSMLDEAAKAEIRGWLAAISQHL
ncbi:MAG: ATP-binding protein [Candidatus Eisenbacteria bacterium]